MRCYRTSLIEGLTATDSSGWAGKPSGVPLPAAAASDDPQPAAAASEEPPPAAAASEEQRPAAPAAEEQQPTSAASNPMPAAKRKKRCKKTMS